MISLHSFYYRQQPSQILLPRPFIDFFFPSSLRVLYVPSNILLDAYVHNTRDKQHSESIWNHLSPIPTQAAAAAESVDRSQRALSVPLVSKMMILMSHSAALLLLIIASTRCISPASTFGTTHTHPERTFFSDNYKQVYIHTDTNRGRDLR